MILRTVLRDCLYLNWAFPAGALPSPPAPLRYQVHPWAGEELVLGSAVLFRQERLHPVSLPSVRLSYPQLNLRLCVLDADEEPAVLLTSLLVPSWVVPAARLVAKQPVAAASFRYPRPSREPEAEGWRWRVRRRGELVVVARPGSSAASSGPALGSWAQTVDYVCRRRKGYVRRGDELRRIEASHRPADAVPLRAEIEACSLLRRSLPLAGREWPALHSAWLCPQVPFVFELGVAVELPAIRRPAGPVAADPAMFAGEPRERRAAAA